MVNKQINENYTEFGTPNTRTWFTPLGVMGRFFSKFFASKAKEIIAKQDDIRPDHPLAGDTVINQETIESGAPYAKSQHSTLPQVTQVELNRKQRYKEYEEMDKYPEISTAFDIYADDSSQKNLEGDLWKIHTENDLAKDEIITLFRMIKLDRFYWDIIRNTCKYGDCFVELVVDLNNVKMGVQRIKVLNPNFIIRVENEYAYLTDFLQEIPDKNSWDAYGLQSQFMQNKRYIELDKNQIIHFRLHSSDPEYYPYGKSIAAGATQIYRNLRMMEDAALIYRMEKAPERRVFYIDVANLPASKAESLIEKIKSRFKKEKYYNSSTNKIDERFNPLCLTGDTKIPLLNGETKTIEEIISSTKEGDTIEIWASDGKKLVPAIASRPFISGKNATIIKVTLDNGEIIKCTPEHKFMLRDGSYKEAQDLTPEDSLFPYYSRVCNGYLHIEETPGEGYKYAHRVIAEHTHGSSFCKDKHIHHKDKNKKNNSKDNLEPLWPREHVKRHFGDNWHSVVSKLKSRKTRNEEEYRKLRSQISKSWWENNKNNPTEKQLKARENLRLVANKLAKDKVYCAKRDARWEEVNKNKKRFGKDNPNYRGGKIICICEVCGKTIECHPSIHKNKKYCSRKCLNYSKTTEYKNKKKNYNHKIISIEKLGKVNFVYDLSVDTYHNFALAAGVVVHNSTSEDFFIATRGNKSSTKIETLPGAQNIDKIGDIEYFRDKLLSMLKIPKDYIVEKDSSPQRKANLSQLDVKFSRTILRVQKNVEIGFESIAKRHLLIKGFPLDIVKKLRIELPEPSDMFTKRRLDVEEQKARVIAAVQSLGLFPREKIYKDFYDLSENEIKEIETKVEKEIANDIQKGLRQPAGMEGMETGVPMGEEEAEVGGVNPMKRTNGIESAENLPPTTENILTSLSILKEKMLLENRDATVINRIISNLEKKEIK